VVIMIFYCQNWHAMVYWMIPLCGSLVICHTADNGCAFRDHYLTGAWFMLVCPRGPLLFSIYMNDLPSVVHGCQLNMYADDMELHCSSVDLLSAQCGLQGDLNSIEFWLRTNQSSLNVGKSHVMLIGSRQKLRDSDLHIIINDRQLSQVPYFKYLGVYIGKNLTWQKHTQYVYQRVQSRLHCLYRLCPLSNELLGKLYCTFVLPILDYCDVVRSPSSVQYFKRPEYVHSKFCSLIPATQSFLQNTLAECRRFYTAIIVYGILLISSHWVT